ncbi:MAG TPA: UDP-N-acetylmuramate dehydrogenase [Candidatus Paceibacterota bacterium]|nr:UDP-N-acetylmuramate dehydrogenase [Candidatus Paceibacterota bacterium]
MPQFKENVPLSKFSHYKIGGPARFFFEARSAKDVQWAVKEAKARKLPVFVLGGGTNLLISDEGFPGLVLRPDIRDIKRKENAVTVGAGMLMAELLKYAAAKSLAGLEWAGGLPGTVGGAVRGNAGCFGGEIKDSVVSVRSFDTRTMKIVERTGRQCAFAYRHSIFKKKNGAEIILSVTLALQKGNKKEIAKAIKERIKYRKEHHPLEHPNIGSIFKNVPLRALHKEGSVNYKKALRESTLAFRGVRFSVKTDPFPVISAAKLISESGLRGVSAGGAMISPKHPNFIVNVLGARSPEVECLIMLAKANVRKKFGIPLEEEVQLL